MSYFSHNPEKWDEIEVEGVVAMVLANDPDLDEDEVRERVESIQFSGGAYWRGLTRDARRYIQSREQDFWGEMAQAAIDRAESQL